MANKLAENGSFAKCLGMNLVNYAIADSSSGTAKLNGCAAQRIADKFNTTDKSFPSLVKAIATSVAFSNRTKGSEGVTQ